eukprot:950573_1
MLALLIISILTLCRGMSTGSLATYACGTDFITKPAEMSCCNGVVFDFRTSACCNDAIQADPCARATPVVPVAPVIPATPSVIPPVAQEAAPITPGVLTGPSLVIRTDPVQGTAITSDATPNTDYAINALDSNNYDVNAVAAVDLEQPELVSDLAADIDTKDNEDDDDSSDSVSDSISSDSDSDSNSESVSDSISSDSDSDSNSESVSDSISSDSASADDDDADGSSNVSSEDDDDSNSVSASQSNDSSSSETDTDADRADGSGFGAFLDGENGHNNGYNTNSTQDMDYYVKITLINMWLILGLILVVNVIFYWCYCRQNRQKMRMDRVRSNNVFLDDPDIARSEVDAEDDLI